MIRHSENCRDCKDTIVMLLKKIYGQVIRQHSLELPARLEGYRGEVCFEALTLIHESLQNHRGHRSFVRTNRLPRVDYFLPGQRMVVEFDESQHFTKPRRISLSLYPEDVRLGYDRQRWMALAAELDRHDFIPCHFHSGDRHRTW